MDYRKQVEDALRSIGCEPVREIALDIWLWYSPRTDSYFTVDSTIPTRAHANDTLRAAGHGPIFPDP